MGGVKDLLMLLSKVTLSFYETSFTFKYTAQSSVDIDKPLYFTTRINEAKNFSGITTGVTKDFWLHSSFEAVKGKKLCAVKLNSAMDDPSNIRYMAYQRDFFDSKISTNISKVKECSSYFDNCTTMNEVKMKSEIGQDTHDMEDYFILNKALLKIDDQSRDDTLQVILTSESYVRVAHFTISNSLYYLIITAAGLHCLMLLLNVVMLLLKRKSLRALITKVKTQ
jgi:hypothetical protein